MSAVTQDLPDSIEMIITPKAHSLGAFDVRRALPYAKKRMVGPFIFFDQMGPADLPPENPINVRPHPHIGLATLTWLYDGVIMHRDSLGYEQEIRPGEINWMTAGKGIVHSERTPEHMEGKVNPIFGIQVWMALPKTHEEMAPSFQHYKAGSVPLFDDDGIKGRVVAGHFKGLTSPVDVYWDTLYLDLDMAKGAGLTLNSEHEERAVYALTGSLEIEGRKITPYEMVVLKTGVDVEVKALEATKLVVIGGAKMDGERFMYWNLVASDKALIEKAKEDWKEGRFDKVINDEVEFIPLPDD
jgi:redox-sensitive bicupin YhaK (pirin superfamily)